MRNNAGFTLLEVMTTIAIIAILSGIAGHNYLSGMPERRVQKSARELYGGIQAARSQAVARGQNVSIVFGASDYTILDVDGNVISSHVFPDYVQLYDVTGDDGTSTYTFNARGMKTDASGRVRIQYYREGPIRRGVRVTTVGGISLIDETGDNWTS